MDYNLLGTQDIIYFCCEAHRIPLGIWHWTPVWMASFLCFIFHMLPWYYFPQHVIWRRMLFSMSLKICQHSCQKMWLEHVVAHLWYFIHGVEKSSIKILSQEFFKNLKSQFARENLEGYPLWYHVIVLEVFNFIGATHYADWIWMFYTLLIYSMLSEMRESSHIQLYTYENFLSPCSMTKYSKCWGEWWWYVFWLFPQREYVDCV